MKTTHQLLIAELPLIRQRAGHLCQHFQDGEDLVQETYLRALHSLDNFQLGEFGPRPWLMTILHNRFCSSYASKRKARQTLQQLGRESDHVSVRLQRCALNWEHVDERIKHAIDSLTPASRKTFLLAAIDGLKCREIATETDAPLGTVMVRLHRARAIVAAQLRMNSRGQRWTRRKRMASVKGTEITDDRRICES